MNKKDFQLGEAIKQASNPLEFNLKNYSDLFTTDLDRIKVIYGPIII